MITFVIKTSGLTGLPAKIKKIKASVLARIPSMLALIGEEVGSRAVEDHLSGPRPAKLGRISGDLARSINYKISGNRVVIGSNLPYARIHEYGGIIRAKRSPFLIFKIGGRWVSVKQVTMPSRSFLRSALKESKKAMRTIVTREANAAIREALA